MIKKRNILAVLAVMCFTLACANASNLTQIDIKKTADNAVDVTFYTTGTASSPMVTRKSNNKYVILMPNVAGSNAGTPDLSAVRDIVTNVDVKNVDDGMNGYTKVTFITTKPVNIKTHMQKSAPVSQEEKEAKALIAQVKSKPVTASETTRTVVTSSKGTPTPVAETKTSSQSTNSEKKISNNSKEKSIPKILEQIPDKKISKAPTAPKSIKKTEPKLTVPPSTPDFSDSTSTTINTKEVENIEKINSKKSTSKIKVENSKNKTPNGGWAIILLPILGLLFLAKLVRNSVQKSIALKQSFEEHLAEKPYVQENYDDIINNSEMNWQERYKKFVEESKGEIKERKYSFISDVKLNDVDKKRLELEGTLNKTPDIYEEQKMDLTNEEPSKVKSEDEAITGELSGLKLKAFAKPVSLHSSIRNKTVPAQLKPRMKEGRHVTLSQTPLNASRRRFKDANLSVSDLINTSKKYIEEAPSNNDSQKYTMSSIDEYFALLDKEKSKDVSIPKDLSSKVAASLANVKPSMHYKKSSTARSSSNPITGKDRTADYFNGLIVKKGYNIDENRGFYLVNLDGVNALVGRIGEEIFVLKKFDSEVNDIQVRLDNGNVYMVKAGDFKSLVDVDENKMGVLIEL